MFERALNWIKGTLSESDGTPSSLRHAFLLWELILAAAFLAIIGYAICSHYHDKTNPYNPVPAVSAIAGLFTANRAAKLGQKNMETTPPATPPTQ